MNVFRLAPRPFRFLLFTLFTLWAAVSSVESAHAAVVADAVSSQSAATGSTSFTFNHVLGVGSARLVVCTVAIANPTAAVANVTPVVTFAGFTMNAIAASQAPGVGQNTSKIESEMFYLNDSTLGNTSGAVAVNVSLPSASSGGVVAGCSSFFGLAQAAPEAAGNNYQGSGTPAASITLTTATAGDLIVDSFAGGYTASTTGKTASPGTGQTQLYTTQLSTAGILGGSSYTVTGGPGAATVTWNETVSRQAYSAVAFAPTPVVYYAVTTTVAPAGTGTITLSPSAGSYAAGSTVTVTASPSPNYTFTGFSGDLTGTTNPAPLTVNSNKSVTANFAVAQCTLTVVSGGNGTVMGGGTFNCGSTVTISASAATGYSFGQWTGAGYTGTNNPASFTLSANTTETASFVQGTTCTLATNVTGSGSIVLNPAGGAYSCGTSVQVTAVPASADFTFSGFSGALTGTTNPQTVTLNANSSVTAAFTQTSFPINITVVGQGTVTPSPSAATYAQGTVVQLTAAPAAGYHFGGFTGDLTSTANPASVTVNSTKNITATFVASTLTQDAVSHGATTTATNTLSFTHVLGAGSSRLVVIEVGFTDGVASPDANAVVTSVLFNGVYATPVPNSLIYGGTSGMVQTQLFYLTDAELPATAGSYPVQVNLAGAISGFQAGAISYFGANQGPAEAVVTHRDTTGADLISTSITTQTPNAVVVDIVEDNNLATLTANSGQTVAWSQSAAVAGTGGSSTKVVPSPGPVTLGWAGSASRLAHSLAAFAPAGDVIPPTYTLSATSSGGGTVSTNPNLTQFPTQTGVLLTASAQTGYGFSGWTGDFTSTANPLAIVMDANHSVVANFTPVPTCTLAVNVIGSGTVTPAAGTYNCGTVLHFVATPSAGFNFTSYTGDLNTTDNPADFTLSANSAVTVEFDPTPMCQLTLNTVGQGSVAPGSGSYACGSIIKLQASAGSGYAFSGFSGDFTGTNNPSTVVLDQAKTITATFLAGTGCTLTTTAVGSGTISPPSGTYACGTTVTVDALPQSHYIFTGYSGDLSGTTTPVPLTLDTNKSVTATFAYNTAGVTGDPRTVTQPTYPGVCTVLKAAQLVSAPVETMPDTARVQAALNACAPGHAVEFSSAGTSNAFLIAPITLPAGVTMLVDADVTILASITYADYNCVVADSWCTSLITVAANSDPAPGSAIMGLGVIDGRGGVKLTDKSTNWWASGDTRPRMIYLGTRSGSVPADNFTLYQITLKNPAKFHVSGPGNNLTVWGIRILTPGDSPNTDGIDPSGSKNITIVNSYVSDGDDMVAVKAGIGHVSNVTIANNHFFSGHGVSVGSETNGGLNNMLVRDNVFDNGFGGSSLDTLRIKSDVSRGGEVYDVLYKNTCVQHGGDTLVFDPYYASKTGSLIPNFHDITISNFHELIRDSAHKVTMQGYNTAGTVYPLSLTLDNVIFDGATSNDFKAPDQVNNAQITLGPGPVNIAGFLTADAAVASNNLTIVNGISNSNAPLDCTNAFVYLTGDLAPLAGSVTAGSPVTVTAVLQNVVSPLVAGTIAYPQQNAPTGTVNLLEGTTVVATATLNGRLAVFTVPSISPGPHTYTAQYLGDSHYGSVFNFGSLTVTAAAVTPPVANAQSVTVGYNTATAITLSATGIGPITYQVVTQPAHGTLAGTAPNLTYSPASGYSGTDSFTFKANNGTDSNTATVSITVTAPAVSSLTVSGFQSPEALQQPGNVTVTVKDGTGATLTSFTGTVTLTSTDPAASLPAAYTYTASDAGTHVFALALGTAGTQSVTATTGTVSASQTGILVTGSTWVLNANGTVARVNGVGTVLASAGTATGSASLGGIAIDSTGNAWAVTNASNSLLFITPSASSGTAYTGGGLAQPVSVAVDGAGQIWVVNTNNSVSAFTATGVALTPSTGFQSNALNLPSAIAIDQLGTLWITNSGNSTVTHIFGGAVPVVAPLVTGATNGTTGTRP